MRATVWSYYHWHTDGEPVFTRVRYIVFNVIQELSLVRFDKDVDGLFTALPNLLYPIDKFCKWLKKVSDSDGLREWRNGYKDKKDIFFKPFYDYGTGTWIRNSDELKAHHKKTGYEGTTLREWKQEAAKQKKIKEEREMKHFEDRVKQVYQDVKQGRSFMRESINRREQVCKEHGIKRLPKC